MFRNKPSGDPQLSSGNLVTVSRGLGEWKGEQKSWKVWEPIKKKNRTKRQEKRRGQQNPNSKTKSGELCCRIVL